MIIGHGLSWLVVTSRLVGGRYSADCRRIELDDVNTRGSRPCVDDQVGDIEQ